MHNEIQDVLGQSFGVPDDLDEDELMGELDALEDEMASELESGGRAGVPSYLQVRSWLLSSARAGLARSSLAAWSLAGGLGFRKARGEQKAQCCLGMVQEPTELPEAPSGPAHESTQSTDEFGLPAVPQRN